MVDVGPGVYELRIRTTAEHRVFYVAKLAEGVYVLHAFQKKTQQTGQRDLELARERYREVLKQRQGESRPPGGSTMDIKITPSSGNVFTDLGFGDDEAEHLRLRSTLMIQVRKLIEERELT
jgi:hypothetical protein